MCCQFEVSEFSNKSSYQFVGRQGGIKLLKFKVAATKPDPFKYSFLFYIFETLFENLPKSLLYPPSFINISSLVRPSNLKN